MWVRCPLCSDFFFMISKSDIRSAPRVTWKSWFRIRSAPIFSKAWSGIRSAPTFRLIILSGIQSALIFNHRFWILEIIRNWSKIYYKLFHFCWEKTITLKCLHNEKSKYLLTATIVRGVGKKIDIFVLLVYYKLKT